jgi:hypothetical protein
MQGAMKPEVEGTTGIQTTSGLEGRACCSLRKGNKQPRCCPKREGRLTSFTAALASQSSTERGAIPKPGLFEKDIVIEVTGQEGNRFWGNQILSGNGEKTEEPMIGELTGENNKTVVIVDTDGYVNGRLVSSDTLSFCYTQAGGKTESSVVSCTQVKRAR